MPRKNPKISFASQSLTQLRLLAKSMGLKGLTKSDRPTVVAALRRATQAKPMENGRREAAYTRQRGGGALTIRQKRRIRKAARRA